MMFAKDFRIDCAVGVLLFILLLPSLAHANIGDHWVPNEESVPVFDGPDRAFKITTYIGSNDVVRQQSNKKIRGFLKVVIPKENYATGYVLEEQLEFLGGMETEKSTSPISAGKPKLRGEVAQESKPTTSGRVSWTVVTMIILLVAAVAFSILVFVRRRSAPPNSPVSTTHTLGLTSEWTDRAKIFLQNIWRSKRANFGAKKENDHTITNVDRSFIDDLLPADFDSYAGKSDRQAPQDVTRKQVSSDMEKEDKVEESLPKQLSKRDAVLEYARRTGLSETAVIEQIKSEQLQLLLKQDQSGYWIRKAPTGRDDSSPAQEKMPKAANQPIARLLHKVATIFFSLIALFFVFVAVKGIFTVYEQNKLDEKKAEEAAAEQAAIQAAEEEAKEAARQAELARIAAMTPEQKAELARREKEQREAAEKKRRAEAKGRREANLRKQGLIWNYHEYDDTMGRGKVSRAYVKSLNQFEFDFPYGDRQRAMLELRKHPKYGKDVILSIERGQFLCGVDECSVTVRFGKRKAVKYRAAGAADNDPTVLFIRNYEAFVSNIKKVDTVVIEATFYREGDRMMEFHVADLEWK